MTETLQTLSQSMAGLVEQSDPKVVRVDARFARMRCHKFLSGRTHGTTGTECAGRL
jgi:hypothetical protein